MASNEASAGEPADRKERIQQVIDFWNELYTSRGQE